MIFYVYFTLPSAEWIRSFSEKSLIYVTLTKIANNLKIFSWNTWEREKHLSNIELLENWK